MDRFRHSVTASSSVKIKASSPEGGGRFKVSGRRHKLGISDLNRHAFPTLVEDISGLNDKELTFRQHNYP